MPTQNSQASKKVALPMVASLRQNQDLRQVRLKRDLNCTISEALDSESAFGHSMPENPFTLMAIRAILSGKVARHKFPERYWR